MYVSHFPRFLVFFFCQNPGPPVCFSHSSQFFSFLLYSRSYSLSFFLPVFQWFSPYFMSYNMIFTFSSFFWILAIFQVLQCVSHIPCFQFSHHNPGPTVCAFLIFCVFSVFSAIFQALKCVFIIFHDCQFSCYTPGPRVYISHFPRI